MHIKKKKKEKREMFIVIFDRDKRGQVKNLTRDFLKNEADLQCDEHAL